MKKFDIAIIGSGPGGYTAAIHAANKKKKVALFEKNLLGGVCLNEGCIPTKTLIHTANFLENLKKAENYGINIENFSFDFSKIKKRKERVTLTLRKGLEHLLLLNKIEIFRKEAKFLSEKEIECGNEKIYADKIIIAAGSTFLPSFSASYDNKYILNSSSILELETLPKTLTIIGGGYIGSEFASLFNLLNVKVTIIEACFSILPNLEKDLSKKLSDIFKRRNIEIYTNTKVKKIEKKEQKVNILLDNEKNIISDSVLIAVGRKPNSENLNLEKINILTDKNGFILTDNKMQTNVKDIYAIGDIKGKYLLAHVASKEGIVASSNALGIEKIMDYKAVVKTIFTNPEIATVGLTKEEAEKNGFLSEEEYFPFTALGKAYTEEETEGFVKITYDKKTDKILGAHTIGKYSSLLISEMALAINNNLKISDIADTIYAHPTFSEAWHETALIAKKNPIHFFKK